jgi:hypothetical protein
VIDDVGPAALEGELRLEAGRIRAGDSDPGERPGSRRPKRLTTWRLTSADQQLLARAAAAFGGRVKPWTRRPTKEPMQWELVTGTARLPVVVAPGSQVEAWWELWDGAINVRRCNLTTERHDGGPCLCKAELTRRGVDLDALTRRPGELAKALACDRYARLQVYLPDLPGLKPWLLTTQSWYSTESLQTAIANELRWVPPLTPVDMVLGSWTVRAKEGQKTVNRVFPVITFDVAPTQTLGELLRASAAARLHALTGSGPPPALTPPPSPPPAPPPSGHPPGPPARLGEPPGWPSGGHIPPDEVVPPHDPGAEDAGGQPHQSALTDPERERP